MALSPSLASLHSTTSSSSASSSSCSGFSSYSKNTGSSQVRGRQFARYRNGGAAPLASGEAFSTRRPRARALASSSLFAGKTKAGHCAVKCRVNVAEKEASAAAELNSPEAEVNQYHFLVANAKFMLDEEEHFQEVLRERLRNYGEKNKKQDFWLVIEPKFLENFPDIANRVKKPAVALVSTDATWITFMKLRLDRVLKGWYEADTFATALASNQVDLSLEQPNEWTAPYPKYESGWWTTFLPPQDSP